MEPQQTPPQEPSTPETPATSHLTYVVGALLCAAVLFGITWKFFIGDEQTKSTANTANTATVVNSTVNVKEYQKDVNNLVESFEYADAVEAARIQEALLELSVPGEFRSFHLQLVSIMQDVQDGNATQAQSRIETLRAQYSWLK